MWSVLGGRKRGPKPYPGPITPGEQRVLELLRLGMTNAHIAERLGITPDGVKYHVSNMLSKLGFEHREQLAAWDGSDPAEGRSVVGLPWWRTVAGAQLRGGAVLALVVAATLALLFWARPDDSGGGSGAHLLTWAGEPMTLAGPSGSGWVVQDVRWEDGNVAVYYYPTDPNGQAALAIRVGTTMIGTSGAIELLDIAPNGLSLAKVRLSRRPPSSSVTFSPGPLQVHLPRPFIVRLSPGAGGYAGTVDIAGDQWDVRGSNRPSGDEFEIRFESGPIPQPLNPVGPTTDVELRDSSGRRYHFRSASFFGDAPTALSFDGPVSQRAGVLTLWVSGPAALEPIPDLIIPLSAVAGTPP